MSPKKTSTTGRKRAVLYLRVSTREQATRGGEEEGFSIPAQREAGLRKAEQLDAEVVKIFVDAGESAKSTDREDLQNMLTYLAEHRLDYVIVHKVDRLARNRADDVMINLAIKGAGAQLISCMENIDDTPSGMLMHGIMSSIAEFYSANLATEAKKGMQEKAKRGGTPGRAPFGYRNIIYRDEQGREVRTIEVDEERARAVRWMYDAYATTNWTTKQIAAELTKRGIQSRPTPKQPARPVTPAQVADMLSNRYYLGYVIFAGVEYKGRHAPLVDEITWQAVQDIKQSRSAKKERPAQHPHYLKSIVRCGECGRALGIQCVRNRQGIIYPYFYCLGRRIDKSPCTQRSIMVARVEELVEEHWRTISLSPELRDQLAEELRQHIKAVLPNRGKEAARAKKRVADLEDQRSALMAAHYAGAVPLDLLRTEQARMAAELADATQSLDQATRAVRRLEAHVDAALALLTDAHAQYLAADYTGRQLMNQAVFEAIWIGDDDVEAAQVRPGLAELVSADLSEQLWLDLEAAETAPSGPTGGRRTRASATQDAHHSLTNPRRTSVKTDTLTADLALGADETDQLTAMPATSLYVADILRSRRSERIPGHAKNLRHTRCVGGSNGTTLVGLIPRLSKLSAALDSPGVQRLRRYPASNDAAPPLAATSAAADTSPAIETDDRPVHALDSPCHPAHTRTSRAKRPRPPTGDRLTEVIRRYESGETLKQIAADLGVSRTFLSGQLSKAGVQTRHHPMREDEVRLASHLYRQGNSLASIATRLGYAKATVSRTLRDAGVAIRDSHGRER